MGESGPAPANPSLPGSEANTAAASPLVANLAPGYEAQPAAGLPSLQEAEGRLLLQSTALATITDGVMITDRAGTIEWVNDAFTALTGFTAADVVGQTPRILKSGFQSEAFYQRLWETISAGDPWHGEITNRRKDGTVYCDEHTITPVRDRSGVVVRFIAVMHDITARRRAVENLRASEAAYRQLFNCNPEPMWVFDLESLRFLAVNDAAVRHYGYSREEFMAMRLQDIRPVEDVPALLARIHGRGEAPTPPDYWRHRKKNGELIQVEIISHNIEFNGRPASLILAHDVSERVRMEDAVRKSEERFRLIAETIEQVFYMSDVGINRMEYISPAYERIWGRTCESLYREPQSFANAIRVEDRSILEAIIKHHRAGLPFEYQYRIIQPDGTERHILDRGFPVRDANGAPTLYVGFAQDVTERERAAAAARQLAAIVSSTEDAIISRTLDGRITSWNPAAERLLGYAAGEIIGQSIEVLIPAGHKGEEVEFNVHLRGEQRDHTYETRRLRKDGQLVDVALTVSPLRDRDGKIVGASKILRDITKRKRADFRLGLEHAITAVLAEGGSLGRTLQRSLDSLARGLGWEFAEVWIRDRSAKALVCSETWYSPGSGLESFAELSRQLVCASGEGMPGKILATGQPDWMVDIATECNCVRKTAAGRAGLHAWIGVPIRGAAQTIAVMGFFSRETLKPDQDLLASLTAIGAQLGQFIEREQLAEQYRQAQKLEAIGTLAGGIAHDFNNIIAAITGYTELARMDVSDRPEIVAHLDAVAKASARAASLVRQILAFSRQQEQERKPMQLRHVVREAMGLLRATVPAMIEFDVSLATDLPPILADASQMHQVIMNLGTNACHAMGNEAGRLGVELEGWQVDAELAQLHPGLRAGAYVRLSVSDTGHGMDAATVSRIFEPFFTTKAAGEGTGLGLAVVHGIMQAHEGVVTVYSQPGEGTVFRLYFPALASPASENRAEPAPLPKGAGQKILFVDDEPPLARLGGKVLERLGYSVQTETSAARVVDLVRAQPSAFDLVVTDLAMPLMTGTDLARELRKVRPDLPILLVTGHSGVLTAEGVQSLGIHDLLTKPLSVHALGTAVQRALQPEH